MPDIKTYLEYIDSNIGIYRSGKDGDEYKPRQDSLPVINNIVTLLEIPSFNDRVRVAGFTEINQEKYRKISSIAENEFLVDYATGIVMFNPIHEGKTFVFSYLGKGLILLSAKRVYVMVQNNPDAVITLQDYIDEIRKQNIENQSLVIQVQNMITEARLAINDSEKSTDNANRAAEEADRARDFALDAYNTTRLVWKEPVAEMKDVYATYPNPTVGWTVQTFSDGKRYRFDGNNWILVDIFGNSIPIASDLNDGLMTIAEHQKLKSYTDGVKDKVIVLYAAERVFQGANRTRIPFPYNGEIISVSAVCGIKGETPFEVDIEKTMNFVDWASVLSRKIKINPQSHSDDKGAVIASSYVQKGDIFRINVTQEALGMEDLTVQIKVRI